MRLSLKHIGILSILFIYGHGFGQEDKIRNSIKSSSLGMAGSSKVIIANNTTYYISQSIGQNSVIGTKTKRNYTILQGYQLSDISIQMVPNFNLDITATIYPNPFEESIQVSFDKPVENEITIFVFDMTGRKLLSKKYAPRQLLTIPLNNFSNGTYSLIVKVNNESIFANIIKK